MRKKILLALSMLLFVNVCSAQLRYSKICNNTNLNTNAVIITNDNDSVKTLSIITKKDFDGGNISNHYDGVLNNKKFSFDNKIFVPENTEFVFLTQGNNLLMKNGNACVLKIKLNTGAIGAVNNDNKEGNKQNPKALNIAYYDAIFAANAYNNANPNIGSYLKSYFQNEKIELATNPFLVAAFPGLAIDESGKATYENNKKKEILIGDSNALKPTNASATSTALLSSLAGVDVTKYVQATADFLKERAKEELTLAFVDRFKTMIDTIPEIRALLPKTYQVFSTTDPFKIPSYGQTYKTAFEQDLQNIIYDFEILVKTNDKYKSIRNNEEFVAFMAAYRAVDLASDGYHAIQILEELDAYYGSDSKTATGITVDKNKIFLSVNNTIHITNVFSRNFKSKDNLGWIDFNDFIKLDTKTKLIFIGLVYQQNKTLFNNIVFNDITKGVSVSLISDNVTQSVITPANIETLNRYLKQLILLMTQIDDRISSIKQTDGNTNLSPNDKRILILKQFANHSDLLVDLLDLGYQIALYNDQLYEQTKFYSCVKPSLYDVSNIAKGIADNNYGLISVNSIAIINRVLFGCQDPATVDDNIENIRKRKIINILTDVSNFIVDIHNADTSAATIKDVLNRYANPVGSYKTKRYSRTSVSLNAYPGFYMGVESNLKNVQSNNFAFGITAPIGFSFNRATRTTTKSKGKYPYIDHNGKTKYLKGSSRSLFVSLIDIGAALSYRFNNDTADLPSKITLVQIFSPGVFYVYGLRNAPVSIMFGVQYAPQLRSITVDGNKLNEIGVLRAGISLVVDIPVLHLYRKEN